MLSDFKPVAFDPYGKRRSRRSVPRWLLLLLCGIAVGVGGVVYVQEYHLPPRLSANESAELRASFQQAESERLRLSKELADTANRLATAVAENKGLADQLATARASAERLRGDLASLVASLPPDPRGGTIEVRAARFAVKDGMLAYAVALSRERAGSKALAGVMQLVLAGESAGGTGTAVKLEPVAIAVAHHEVLRGSLPLPDGLRPRQATIQLLDREGGRLLGMRVIVVR